MKITQFILCGMTFLCASLFCLPGSAQQNTSYQPLLTLYSQNIRKVAQERNAGRRSRYVANVAERRKIFQDMAAREVENLNLLEKSANHRQHHQLDFDGEVPEFGMVMLGCPASGRIFTTLCREKKVDELLLVAAAERPWLLPAVPIICPEWVLLLREIDRRHLGSPIFHRIIIKTLYAAGVDRQVSRPLLVKLARSSDYDALALIFFTYDRTSGERLPQTDRQNLRLLKQLTAHPQSTDPEVLEVCAEYAATVRQDALAKAICTRLLQQRYQDHDHPNQHADIPADCPLGRARCRAINLMFYSLPDAHLFRLIYDMSREPDAAPAERLDKELAESYIGMVHTWEKGGKSPNASPFGA